MMKYYPYLLIAMLVIMCTQLSAQEASVLKNPSFEGKPQHSITPIGWDDRGFAEESAPDTHPSGDFGVTREPYDGKSYLGMVVRDNDTWECVGQKLSMPLLQDSCYTMSLHATRSKFYVSISRMTGKEVNFNKPCRLRLYGASGREGKGYELLAETPLIDHTDWQQYTLTFTPTMDVIYIYLEAYYESDAGAPYNGNVLVDNLEGIWRCGDEK
jgi:hypothetical protein